MILEKPFNAFLLQSVQML